MLNENCIKNWISFLGQNPVLVQGDLQHEDIKPIKSRGRTLTPWGRRFSTIQLNRDISPRIADCFYQMKNMHITHYPRKRIHRIVRQSIISYSLKYDEGVDIKIIDKIFESINEYHE